MTDGEDNNPKGEATIRNDIGARSARTIPQRSTLSDSVQALIPHT